MIALPFAGPGVGSGAFAGVDQSLDLRPGERHDRALLRFRPVDEAHQVGPGVALTDGPGPEGAEAGVDVEALFFGQRPFGPFGDAGRGARHLQVGHEAAELVGGDGGQRRIGRQEGLQAAQAAGIIGDGGRREAAGLEVEQEAVEGLAVG